MIDERLTELMAAILGVDPSTVNENTSVETVEAWDSLCHMNLVLTVEDEFAISFPDSQIPELTSYGALRDSISALVGEGLAESAS